MRIIFLSLICVGIAGCTLDAANSDPGTVPESQIATSVAATEQALLSTNQQNTTEPVEDSPPELTALLPHSLYYLSSADGENYQVWVLNRNGNTATRLTAEPSGVDEFSVSRADGRVAYITNNQLHVIDINTDQHDVLVDGSELVEETDEYFFTQKISGLSWAPDGKTLAYGRNGLHIYDFTTQLDEHIILNDLEARDSGTLFPRALYSPFQWSPDGSQLLITINYYEAGTLGIYTPGNVEILKLGEGIVCCHPAWSTDNRSIVIASPFLGFVDSGLWRIDTATGIQTELIPATSPDNTLNYAGWPVVLANGDLRYFYTNTPSFPTGDVPLLMVNTANDGVTDRTILRPEQWLNYEILWAENGTLAVAVQPVTGEAAGWPRIGPIVLIPPSEDSVTPLGINGYQLQWGP
jgi:WD40 repeat protein